MKPFDIEIQRLKSIRHDRGMLELKVDAAVTAMKLADDGAPSSAVRLSVDDARTLVLLLRQSLGELDKLQPRSRRSGRA